MKKIFSLYLLLFFCVTGGMAQYHFTAQVVYSSGCNDHTNVYHDDFDLTGAISLAAAKSMCEDFSSRTWETADWCEAARETVLSWNSTTACRIKVVASQCVGPNGGKIGDINLQGPSTGSSYYSTNPAEEVQNWAEDAEAMMDALNANSGSGIVTDDGYLFTGRMPGDIKKFIASEDGLAEIRNPGKHSGVTGLDDYINSDRKFTGIDPWEDWRSDDLNPINIKLKPLNYRKPKERDIIDEDMKDYADIAKELFQLGYSLAKVTSIPVLLLTDIAINLYSEEIEILLKIYNGEHVIINDIPSTSAYNTLNNTYDDVKEVIKEAVSITTNITNMVSDKVVKETAIDGAYTFGLPEGKVVASAQKAAEILDVGIKVYEKGSQIYKRHHETEEDEDY